MYFNFVYFPWHFCGGAGFCAARHPVLGERHRQHHRLRQAWTALVLLHPATDALPAALQKTDQLPHHQETDEKGTLLVLSFQDNVMGL